MFVLAVLTTLFPILIRVSNPELGGAFGTTVSSAFILTCCFITDFVSFSTMLTGWLIWGSLYYDRWWMLKTLREWVWSIEAGPTDVHSANDALFSHLRSYHYTMNQVTAFVAARRVVFCNVLGFHVMCRLGTSATLGMFLVYLAATLAFIVVPSGIYANPSTQLYAGALGCACCFVTGGTLLCVVLVGALANSTTKDDCVTIANIKSKYTYLLNKLNNQFIGSDATRERGSINDLGSQLLLQHGQWLLMGLEGAVNAIVSDETKV
jgi:hypothetical protein